MSAPVGAHLSDADFRRAMAHVPTSVAIVSATDDEGTPHGLVVGSFSSLSLEPFLVSFSAMSSSRAWAAIRTTGRIGISVLAAGHEGLVQRFMEDRDSRFADGAWDLHPSGTPRLADALVWVYGRIHAIHAAGDHDLVVCSVDEVDHRPGEAALLFDRKSYAAARPLPISVRTFREKVDPCTG